MGGNMMKSAPSNSSQEKNKSSHSTVELELLTSCKQELPTYMIPSYFVLLDRFPLNANGKVDRNALPAPNLTTMGSCLTVETPVDEIDVLVLQAFESVLGRAVSPSINLDFFEQGGNSLLAIKLVAFINANTQFPSLRIADVFRSTTVGAIASCVRIFLTTQTTATAHGTAPPQTSEQRIRKQGKSESIVSLGQQGIMLHEHVESFGVNCYRIPIVMRIEGEVDMTHLMKCLHTIHERHEILRTTLHLHQDACMTQKIHAADDLPFRVRSDVGAESAIGQQFDQTLTAAFIATSVREPFDLDKGPLWTVSTRRVGDGEMLLVLVFHHAVFDGESCAIILHELSALMAGQISGGPLTPLPLLPIQYSDYSIWESERLYDGSWAESVAFWQKTLCITSTESIGVLPVDRPRPQIRIGCADMVRLIIPASTVHQIKQAAHVSQSTLFMTLLSCTFVFLQRLCQSDDVRIGSVASQRNKLELQNMVGFFVNTIVYRLGVDPSETFPALLLRVRELVLETSRHWHVPLSIIDRFVESNKSVDNAPRTIVSKPFEVMMSFDSQLAHTGEDRLPFGPNAKAIVLDPQMASAIFDLDINIKENGENGLCVDFHFASDIFDRATIESMSLRFALLLDGLVDPVNSLLPISRMPWQLPSEQQLSRQLSDTVCNLGPFCGISETFARTATNLSTSTTMAVTLDGHSMSYADLFKRADHMARHLFHNCKIPTGAVVALCVERSMEFIVGMLAIVLGGYVYLPLSSSLPVARSNAILHATGAAAMITHPPLLYYASTLDMQHLVSFQSAPCTSVHESSPCVIWENCSEVLENLPLQSIWQNTKPESILYIIPTSGSTGQPKFVAITHGNIHNYLGCWSSVFWGGDPSDGVILQLCQPSFDAHIEESLVALCSGARVVMLHEEGHMDFAYITNVIASECVTHLDPVPSFMRALTEYVQIQQVWDRLASIRCITLGGETLSPSLIRLLRSQLNSSTRLLNTYGPAECTIVSTIWECTVDDCAPDALSVPIGRPLPNYCCAVIDKHANAVPIGIVGELCVGGAGVFAGYVGRPDLTAAAMIDLSHIEARLHRAYRTGDLVKQLPSGALTFIGRVDHQVHQRASTPPHVCRLNTKKCFFSFFATVYLFLLVARASVPASST
jgi:amino acid adenylation domain-containing protein